MNFNFNQGFRPMGFPGMPQMHFPAYSSASPQMPQAPQSPAPPQQNPGALAMPAFDSFRDARQAWWGQRPQPGGAGGMMDWFDTRPRRSDYGGPLQGGFLQGLLPNFNFPRFGG